MTNLLCKENDYYSSPKASSIEQSCVGSISTISKHIEDINRNYFKDGEFCFKQKRKTFVRFSDMSLNKIIDEPEDLVEDLAMARKSDFKKGKLTKLGWRELWNPFYQNFIETKFTMRGKKIEMDVVNKIEIIYCK